MSNEYYVYEHATEDGDVYYIGKGKGDRAWSKQGRNDFWRKKALKHGMAVSIVEDGLTEQEALDLEVSLISQYGRRDNGTGCLVNLTDGGEGASGASLRGEWNKILEDEGLGIINPTQENYRVEAVASRPNRHLPDIDERHVHKSTLESTYESEQADDMWEAFALAHVATPREAGIADRARGSICGLDSYGRPKSLRLRRKHRELPRDWRKRIHDHIINAPVCAYS